LHSYAQFRKAQLQQMLQGKIGYATAQCVVLIHSCQLLPYPSIKSFPSLQPLYDAAPSTSPATQHAFKFSPSTIAISKSWFSFFTRLIDHGSASARQVSHGPECPYCEALTNIGLIGPSLISSLSSASKVACIFLRAAGIFFGFRFSRSSISLSPSSSSPSSLPSSRKLFHSQPHSSRPSSTIHFHPYT
jgi:hypothetical protein